ncbi:MAG: class II fructose-bisphosphate aldolase family protein [Candidatus Staskawiczbacteria bacterium]|nr:class II fructose-bisphosphate aldolase family protein [Candidatus Staskawiczbacteria bacterium]
MKNIRFYLEKAQKEKFAIGQFNFSDFTQVKAIVASAQNLKSPVILGTSEGESKFFGLEEAVAIRNVLRKKTGLPIFLNLDHGKSFEYVKQAIDAGYDMVHFDGSKLPLEENIKITKEVVKYAKWRGVTVEGEVGRIGTDSSKLYSDKFEIKEEDLTKPEEALRFLNETKANLLAVSIGNFHGIEISGVDPNLRLDVLKAIKDKIGNAFLVLHGGSGTPEDDMKEAIKMGIVKININTELRLAFSGNLRRFLDSNPQEIAPYNFLADAERVVEKVVGLKIKMFGSENKA